MPDKRTHRGPNPKDIKLFSVDHVSLLQSATADLSLLLTKGYAQNSALKLVGDRFNLTQRQRLAVMRCACSDAQLTGRKQHHMETSQLKARDIAIDCYNVLITIEAALSGAFVFIGRDNCYRDLAGIHGTYRKLTETVPALELIGRTLEQIAVGSAVWYLDRPVSNSGKLKLLIGETAQKNNWPWNAELVFSPDAELVKTDSIVVSSDSVVLDAVSGWTNLAAHIIAGSIPNAKIINLSGEPALLRSAAKPDARVVGTKKRPC